MIIKNIYLIIAAFLSAYMLTSCADAPDFSDTPTLRYVGLSKLQLEQSNFNEDTIVLFLEFEDGDGDIGLDVNEIGTDVYLIDKRTQDTAERIKTPFVPQQGAANGIRGEMSIRLFTTCCIFADGTPPCSPPKDPNNIPSNDLQYEVLLRDRAGNWSNSVDTDIITLICN